MNSPRVPLRHKLDQLIAWKRPQRQYPRRIEGGLRMSLLASRSQLRASLLRWVLLLVPAIVLAGFVSGELAQSGPGNPWFDSLIKPASYPSPALFGIVWAALYAMMGFACAAICSAWGAFGRKLALAVFAGQLLLNLAWPPLFFAGHQIAGALLLLGILDVLVLLTVVLFWRIRWYAGALLVPYWLWLVFATFLTWQILEANPQASAMHETGAVQRIAL